MKIKTSSRRNQTISEEKKGKARKINKSSYKKNNNYNREEQGQSGMGTVSNLSQDKQTTNARTVILFLKKDVCLTSMKHISNDPMKNVSLC